MTLENAICPQITCTSVDVVIVTIGWISTIPNENSNCPDLIGHKRLHPFLTSARRPGTRSLAPVAGVAALDCTSKWPHEQIPGPCDKLRDKPRDKLREKRVINA